MIRKILLSIALFTIIVSLASCGGSGGGGSSSQPQGVNPGIPSVVQLLAVQSVAQTNSFITFKAKVLDGNGNPVKNEPVTFINLSSIGTFLSGISKVSTNPSGVATGVINIVYTDSLGYASIQLSSTDSGFVTIQVEVYTGAGNVRDQRTVFFTISDTLDLRPTLTLDVDGDGDGVYNETAPPGNDDFTLFEAAGDDQVLIRATVKDGIGRVVVSTTVTFATDAPYRVGLDPSAQCSDGSGECEVTFPYGNTATTNSSGEASVLIQVTPGLLRTIATVLNVTAVADNGAFSMVTLFLSPVTVATVTLSANPASVSTGGTSTITAAVITILGTPVPDGTVVSFTTTCGTVTPFAQTTDGMATATFTAPLTEGTCTITGTVAGMSGSVTVTVTITLTVSPSTQTVDPTGAAVVATFTITGGTPVYTVYSSDPLFPPVPTSVTTSGGTFTVTVPADTPDTTVTYTVMDTVGNSVTATLNITAGAVPSLLIVPGATSADGISGDTLTFTISGGTPTYIITSGDLLRVCNDDPLGVPDGLCGGAGDSGTWSGATDPTTITVTVPPGAAAGPVTLSVIDSTGATTSATITIIGPGALVVTPSETLNLACGGNVLTYTITGGIPSYTVVSGNPLITIGGGPFTFSGVTFTATSAGCVGGVGDTDVDIIVTDSNTPPAVVTVTITVNDP